MTQLPWQASADLSALSARAALLQQLRHFLQQRNLLEVDVPALGRAAVTDPHIDSIAAQVCDETFYLQTSPEFYMKRLLASGSGDIYSLAKAFRNGEAGRKHNPEFTMLEWYRLGWTDHQLMDEVSELLQHCLSLSSIERISYRSLFQRHLGVDPHRASVEQLKSLANQHGEFDWPDSDRDTWLDLLMTHVIEPNMGEGLMLVHDFPASQAALARLHKDSEGELIARRFEAYVGGVELANGYWELCDSEEQAARLERDLSKRAQLNLPQYPSDQCLVAALEAGLHECAGVALGVDRLLMLVSGISDIRQLMAFPFDRA